jgi:hypothetical protein
MLKWQIIYAYVVLEVAIVRNITRYGNIVSNTAQQDITFDPVEPDDGANPCVEAWDDGPLEDDDFGEEAWHNMDT